MKQTTDQWTKRKENKDAVGGYSETHPSYGIIGISRVQGRSVLFGSEVQHMHFISLTISEASRHVNTPREFLMADRKLIRIEMTDSQFAQMITSPNQGDGVACTIDCFAGDDGQPWLTNYGGRPSPPQPEHYTKRYKDAMGKRADLISDGLKTAKEKADRLFSGEDKPTKANLKELSDSLRMAQMNLDQNLPYVMEEMEEGVEKRMAAAVSEFESYVAFSLQAKGLEDLASQSPRLTVGEQKALPEDTK
jgi:hypothetical protein